MKKMLNAVKREENGGNEEGNNGSRNHRRKRERKEGDEMNNSSDKRDIEEYEKNKIKNRRYSFDWKDGEDDNTQDHADSTVSGSLDSSQSVLEMELNIERSTLQQNGDQQHEEKIIQVEVAEPTNPTMRPIVVSFPGGCVPSSETEASLPIIFHAFQRSPHSTRGLLLRGTDEKCTYISSNQGRGYDNRKTKTLVGVFNPQQESLVLYLAAERGTVFPMQQFVSSTNDVTATMTNQKLSWEARNSELHHAFGSSRKQKYLKSVSANKVDANSIVEASTPAVLLETGVANKREDSSTQDGQVTSPTQLFIDPVVVAIEESRLQLLPRFDKDAILPCLVYDAQSIAGEDAWNQISRVVDACIGKGHDDWAKALMQGPRLASKYTDNNANNAAQTRHQWPSSLVRLIDLLKDEKNPNDKKVKHRIKIILLLRHVMKLHAYANQRHFLKGTAEELAKVLAIPTEVSMQLLTVFATPMEHSISGEAGFVFTKQLKDKRTAHALLLYMMAHGDSMMVSSMKVFLNDLELNLSLATKLLTEAGCSVKKHSEGNDISVALTVPLQFPRARGTKGGGGKR